MSGEVLKLETGMMLSASTVESLVLNGDLNALTPEQRVEYVKYRCASLGLDPAAKPFELLKLNGKLVLYATKACTEQLCERRGLSVALGATEKIEDVLQVAARVSDGRRSTENVGVVAVGNLKGEALANALMKARTKAIRRTVLAHCGLGMLDETEVETITGAVKIEQAGGNVASSPRVSPETSPAPSSEVASATEQAPVVDVVASTPGSYVIEGGVHKGKQMRELTDDQRAKTFLWCQAHKDSWWAGAFMANCSAYNANPAEFSF